MNGIFDPGIFDLGVFDVKTLGLVLEIPVSAVTAIEIEVSVMAQAGKNIAIPRGSRVTLAFPNIGAEDLPGTSMHFTLARSPNSRVKIIGPKTCSVPDEADKYTCVLSSEDTDVAPGKYFYDTRCVDAGAETLLASGICVITPIAELPEAPE